MTHSTNSRNEERNRLMQENDHLGMMVRPDLWPGWPVLPMKRYVGNDKTGKQMEPGILISRADDKYLFIPGANIFENVKTDDPRVTPLGKDDLQTMVIEEGWVVD